jgi:prolipoprotein diacylglyceryltransferase
MTSWFLWVVVASVVGARAVHVVANWSYYSGNPGQILSIWHGGLSSFGGLLGGVPAGLLVTRRRYPELRGVVLLDVAGPVLAAAWGIGRLLGPQLMVAGGGARTTAWYGMYYAQETGKRVPVPIIQAIDSFVIFGILLLVERIARRRPTGFVIAAAMALWGLSRFFEERFFLGAHAQVGSSQSESGIGPVLVQGAGLALFAAGVLTMVWLWRRFEAGRVEPAALPVADIAGAESEEPASSEDLTAGAADATAVADTVDAGRASADPAI